MVSEVRYARSGDVHIAYRVAGEGPFDVVLVPGTTSHVELTWEVPFFHALFERIASFARRKPWGTPRAHEVGHVNRRP